MRDTDLVQLRRLLLVEDRQALDVLREDVARLELKVGSDARFRRSVADSLVVALKVAEIENHRELAAAMAPLVVSGIRHEIERSRDMMVEALYPITGRMVAVGIGAMFKQLSEEINGKLDAALSPKRVQLRIKAMITRRPVGELILAEAGQARIERLILIERTSGAVLATTDAEGAPEADPDGSLNLLGGLVSAIVEFARHALSENGGELRQIDLSGQAVLLRASPVYIVAAVFGGGAVSASLSAAVDEAFLCFLPALADGALDDAIASLHRTVVGRTSPAPPQAKRPSPLVVIGAILGLATAVFVTQAVLRSRSQAREDRTLASIERMPALAGLPVRLALDRHAGVIRADGVVADETGAQALSVEIARAFPGYPVDARFAVISQTAQAKSTDEALRLAREREAALGAELTGLQARLDKLDADHAKAEEAAGQAAAASREQRRLDGSALQGRFEDLHGELAALGARLDTPARRLDEAARAFSIFFTAGATFRDPVTAQRDLARLARLLAQVDGARLRIVGYGDGAGTAKGNAEAARARAEKVAGALQQLGIAASRLVVVSTRGPLPISDAAPAVENRRVTFELAFNGE